MTPSRDMKQLIMFLATLAVTSLVYVTWSLMQVSTWIISHDPIWERMDSEGAGRELAIAEAFHFARFCRILEVEALIGSVFLFLLWRVLLRTSENERVT